MNYVWAKTLTTNQVLDFCIDIDKPCDVLKISAVDFYQVFVDGKFLSFGPNRAPSGFSRISVLSIKSPKNIRIRVNYYGVETYACDLGAPFFGVEVLSGDTVVYNTNDFVCKNTPEKQIDVPKFSYQHGFLEVYDFNKSNAQVLPVVPVNAPVILGEVKDENKYLEYAFSIKGSGEFTGFDEVKSPWWADKNKKTIVDDFIEDTKTGYKYIDYVLPCEKTGFIKLNIKTQTENQVYIAFEEVLPDGKWVFGRTHCYDYMTIKTAKNLDFMSLEPYSFKHLKIIYKGDMGFDIKLVGVENENIVKSFNSKDTDLNLIYNAGKESFCQNAFDIFSDCPTRERAGWLCDSFFLGRAERYLTEKNDIEKRFLENYIVGEFDEIEKGMLPKCFPAQHKDKIYIPNWSMWFIIELKDYLDRSGDRALIDSAKDKVYGIVNFFDKYLNSDGLLENLESWVFVDYSDSNTYPYLSGVNYPSNMLYAYMLSAVDYLYGDNALKVRAESIKKTIFNQSFNGEFFIENAKRVDGKLELCSNHITEACQYYALYTGLYNEKTFSGKVKTGLSRTNKTDYPYVSRSTGFVGIYLRLLWLDSIGESRLILDEIKAYFLPMAKLTGTLWEYDSPQASCNHGFTSIVCQLIDKNYKE